MEKETNKIIKIGKTKTNIILSVAYQLLVLIIPLISTPYVSRVFNKDLIGEVQLFNAISSYFVMFAILGLANYGSRYIAKNRDTPDSLNTAFSELQTFHFLTAFVALLAYTLYSLLFTQTAIAKIYIITLVASLFDISWFFYGIENLKVVVVRNSVIKLASLILIFVLVRSVNDLWLYALILCLSVFVSNITLWPFLLRKGIRFRFTRLSSLKKHIKPLIIMFLPVIGINLYKYMDKIMLSFFSIGDVGLYSNAEVFISVPICFLIAASNVLLPHISNAIKNADDNSKKQTIDRYLRPSLIISVWFSCGMAAGIAGISKEFSQFYYGNGYEGCSQIISVLMLSSVFLAVANVVRTQVLMPQSKDKEYVISIFSGAGVNIIFNAILIPVFGAVGAAIATVFAEAVVCIIQLIQSRNLCDARRDLKKILQFPLIALITFTLMIMIPGDVSIRTMVIKGGIGLTVFLSLSFAIYLLNIGWIDSAFFGFIGKSKK